MRSYSAERDNFSKALNTGGDEGIDIYEKDNDRGAISSEPGGPAKASCVEKTRPSSSDRGSVGIGGRGGRQLQR